MSKRKAPDDDVKAKELLALIVCPSCVHQWMRPQGEEDNNTQCPNCHTPIEKGRSVIEFEPDSDDGSDEDFRPRYDPNYKADSDDASESAPQRRKIIREDEDVDADADADIGAAVQPEAAECTDSDNSEPESSEDEDLKQNAKEKEIPCTTLEKMPNYHTLGVNLCHNVVTRKKYTAEQCDQWIFHIDALLMIVLQYLLTDPKMWILTCSAVDPEHGEQGVDTSCLSVSNDCRAVILAGLTALLQQIGHRAIDEKAFIEPELSGALERMDIGYEHAAITKAGPIFHEMLEANRECVPDNLFFVDGDGKYVALLRRLG